MLFTGASGVRQGYFSIADAGYQLRNARREGATVRHYNQSNHRFTYPLPCLYYKKGTGERIHRFLHMVRR